MFVCTYFSPRTDSRPTTVKVDIGVYIGTEYRTVGIGLGRLIDMRRAGSGSKFYFRPVSGTACPTPASTQTYPWIFILHRGIGKHLPFVDQICPNDEATYSMKYNRKQSRMSREDRTGTGRDQSPRAIRQELAEDFARRQRYGARLDRYVPGGETKVRATHNVDHSWSKSLRAIANLTLFLFYRQRLARPSWCPTPRKISTIYEYFQRYNFGRRGRRSFRGHRVWDSLSRRVIYPVYHLRSIVWLHTAVCCA